MARRLYAWASEVAATKSPNEVVDQLSHLVEVRRNEQHWSWAERVAFRRDAGAAPRFSVSVATWSSGDRTLVCLTAVYVTGLEPSTFVLSAPTFVMAGDGQRTVTSELDTGDTLPSPTLSGVLLFIEPARADVAAWPDLLVAITAEGRVEGLQLRQLHPQDAAGLAWRVIWGEEWISVSGVRIEPTGAGLTVTWSDNPPLTEPRPSPDTYASRVRFHHGRAADEAEPIPAR